jgi:TPR repeat protein
MAACTDCGRELPRRQKACLYCGGRASDADAPATEAELLAQHVLAHRLIRGDGVPKDVRRGVTLMREAAEAGFPGAVYTLAQNPPLWGDIVTRGAVVRWLRRAADGGDQRAKELMVIVGAV